MNNDAPNFDRGSDPLGGERLPADLAGLGRALDGRGRTGREALSAEALERIVAMSDLQLPIAGPNTGDAPVVIARIGPDRSGSARFWRIAAAVAVVAGLGAAALLLSRGSGDSEPAPGTLVEGTRGGSPSGGDAGSHRVNPLVPPTVAPGVKRDTALTPEHLERALAVGNLHSASSMVVALSGPINEPAVHYHDLDDAVVADIAPLFHAGALLDGGGTTYEDLTGELAAIVAPASFR